MKERAAGVHVSGCRVTRSTRDESAIVGRTGEQKHVISTYFVFGGKKLGRWVRLAVTGWAEGREKGIETMALGRGASLIYLMYLLTGPSLNPARASRALLRSSKRCLFDVEEISSYRWRGGKKSTVHRLWLMAGRVMPARHTSIGQRAAKFG